MGRVCNAVLDHYLLLTNLSCVIASAIRLYYVTKFFTVSIRVNPKQFEGMSSVAKNLYKKSELKNNSNRDKP
jgi:hypothetical protein